jgi:hypothetical protein
LSWRIFLLSAFRARWQVFHDELVDKFGERAASAVVGT